MNAPVVAVANANKAELLYVWEQATPEGKAVIVLLGGGSKRRQDADIAAVVERWKRHKQ